MSRKPIDFKTMSNEELRAFAKKLIEKSDCEIKQEELDEIAKSRNILYKLNAYLNVPFGNFWTPQSFDLEFILKDGRKFTILYNTGSLRVNRDSIEIKKKKDGKITDKFDIDEIEKIRYKDIDCIWETLYY